MSPVPDPVSRTSRADTTEGRTAPREPVDWAALARTMHDAVKRALRPDPEEYTTMPETAPRPDVPDEVMRAFVNGAIDSPPEVQANSPEWVRNGLIRALAAYERQVRERVAAEYRAAAQAIEDSRGETRDPLAEEIWQTCRQEFYATCDDPRTIAAVAYRHIAHRIEEAR